MEEKMYYCGKCGTKVQKDDVHCPNCKEPLSETLVVVTDEELTRKNVYKRLNGVKGYVQSKYLEKKIPDFWKWLNLDKNMTPREWGSLSPAERSKIVDEYKEFLRTR